MVAVSGLTIAVAAFYAGQKSMVFQPYDRALDDGQGILAFQGVWKAYSSEGFPIGSKQAVAIDCVKAAGACSVAETQIQGRAIETLAATYTVQSWTEGVLIAVRKEPCWEKTLNINLKTGGVTRGAHQIGPLTLGGECGDVGLPDYRTILLDPATGQPAGRPAELADVLSSR